MNYFVLYIHTGHIKEVSAGRYLLALGTSLGVCQPHILDDSFLAVAEIPGLCHMNAFSLLLFIDGICGLAHTLSSSLKRKISLSLASSLLHLCGSTFHKPPAAHRSCASA